MALPFFLNLRSRHLNRDFIICWEKKREQLRC